MPTFLLAFLLAAANVIDRLLTITIDTIDYSIYAITH